jgi:hypothetical protein
VLVPTCTDSNGASYSSETYTFNPIVYTPQTTTGNKVICVVGTGSPYTAKPFVVAPNFDPGSAPVCPLLNGSEGMGNCVLFQNQYLSSQLQGSSIVNKRESSGGVIGMFDLEKVGDFTMCGYYTNDPNAPSYLQRLLSDPYSRKDALGIETFVIGNYANDSSIYGPNGNGVSSRLDTEIFDTGVNGIKVRGLPGCRSYESCSDNPQTGVFAISASGMQAYGLVDIACNNGAAGCG